MFGFLRGVGTSYGSEARVVSPANGASTRRCAACSSVRLALTLLVASVLADDHDDAMTTDDLALVADRLDAGIDLHRGSFSSTRLRWDGLLVAVDDAAASEVVRGKFYDYPIVRKDPDVVHPHLPADVREDLVPVVQLNSEHCVWQ